MAEWFSLDGVVADGLPFWQWWVLGLLLLIVEVLAPGTFMMWLGFAAFATGLAVWPFARLGLAGQGVVFALFSLASVGLWFRFRPLMRERRDEPALNRRGSAYLGRVLTLVEAIRDGVGQARLEDSVWRVTGPDLPAGATVKVVGIEGATLRVEPADRR